MELFFLTFANLNFNFINEQHFTSIKVTFMFRKINLISIIDFKIKQYIDLNYRVISNFYCYQ